MTVYWILNPLPVITRPFHSGDVGAQVSPTARPIEEAGDSASAAGNRVYC